MVRFRLVAGRVLAEDWKQGLGLRKEARKEGEELRKDKWEGRDKGLGKKKREKEILGSNRWMLVTEFKPPNIIHQKKNTFEIFTCIIFIGLLCLSSATLNVDASPESTIINTATNYDFSIQGVTSVSAGSVIKITLPSGLSVSGVSSDNMPTCTLKILVGITVSTLTGSCVYNPSDSGSQTITYTFASAQSSLSLINLLVGQIVNPDSARYLSSFIVQVGSEIDSSISLTTYTVANLASASVSNAVQTAGTANKITFTFRLTNSIPQNGVIQITWPSEVSFKQTSADSYTTVTIYGTTKTGFTTTVTQASRTIVINGLFSSVGITAQANDVVIVIDQFNNPTSQITSSSFGILTMNSKLEGIDQRNTGLTISSTSPGVITISSFVLSTYSADAQFTAQFYETTDISPSSAYLKVYWPSEVTYVSSVSLSCTLTFGFTANTPPCTVDTTNNYVQLSYYKSSAHFYSIGTFQNPLGALTSSSWKLIVTDLSGNIIMQTTTGITATTTTNSITVTTSTRPSGSTTVAIRTDYTLAFTTSTRMLSTSSIKLIFPKDQVLYDGSTTCYNGATALTCTLSDVDSNYFKTEITQWCNSGGTCSAGSTINFTLKNAINPGWVTSPLTSSLTIQTINNALSGNPVIDQVTSGVQFSPTLTPGVLTNIAVVKDSTTNKVGGATSYTISFTLVTVVPTGGQIKFTLPSYAVYKDSSTSVVCKDAASTAKTCTSSVDSNYNIQTITITDACSSGCSASSALSYTISQVYNPGSTKPISTSFQANSQTSNPYLIDSGTAATTSGFTLVANSFTSVTINLPSGTIIVGDIPEYKFTIVLNNAIPSSGGKLTITFPSQIAVQSAGTCTAVISSTNHVCVVSSTSNTVTVTFNSDAAKGSSLVVDILNGIKNPTIAQQSNYISFASTLTDSGTTYDIDQNLASITVTPNTYGTLASTSVTRVDSSKINDVTNVNLKATSANPILSGSKITVNIPLDQFVLNVATINDLTFYQLGASDVVGSQLTPTSITNPTSYISVIFTEWCSSGGSSCSAGSENIKLRITGLKNPANTLPPSNSFKIYVDSSGGLKIDSKESSLFATPSIQAGPLSSVTITRDTNVVGTSTTYTVTFTTSNSITQTNGIFLSFSPPSGLLFQGSSVSCTYQSVSVTSSNCLITTQSTSYGNGITNFKVPMSCSSTSCGVSTYTVTFTGLKNPFSTQTPTGTITVATQGYDGSQYYNNDVLDVNIATSATSLQTLTPGVCTGTAVRSVTTVNTNTQITCAITLANRILANSYIRIKLPLQQFTQTGATIQYMQSGGSSASDMTVVSTDSSYALLEFKEFCSSGGTLCADSTTMTVVITQGFKNTRTSLSSYTNYFTFYSYTTDKTYMIDQSTANVIATPSLTLATISSISVAFQSSTVAYDGYVDISAVLGSSLLSTDYVEFSFSAEFLLQSTSTVTCGKVVSGTATSLTCTPTITSGYLSYVKIDGLCACDSTTTYTIRLSNIRNILEAKAFTGTLTINTKASATESIGTGSLSLSTISTLTPGTLTSTSVSRSATAQGATATFTLSFTTPGVLLDSSTIQLGLPLNQIVMSSAAYVCTDPTTSTSLTCSASPTATSTYNYLTINEWKCSSSNCASGTTFSVQITQSKNPSVAAISYDPFLIYFISPSSNKIFQAPSSLNALPDIEVGALNNHVVTFQNTQYTLSTTEYLTSFDTTSAIPSGGKVVFTFPDYRIWKSGTGSIVVTYGSSYSSTYSSPTITWDSTSTYLTQISLNSFCTSGCAIGSYQFKFSSGIKNPDYVQPLTGNFVAYTTDSSGAIVNRDIKSNADVSPILPTPMTATITRSVSTLSTATVLTVSFTTVNPFPSGGKILLYMPTDQIKLTGSSVTCTKSDGTTSLTCSLTTSGSYYIVTINEWCTSGSGTCAAATSMSFMISGVVNPSLLSANVASTSWQVLTATSLSYSIDGKYTSLKPSPDLQGVAVTFTVASVANPVVYAQTTLNVGFTPNSNLPSNAIIEIGIPSGFALSPTTQSCLQLSPSSATLTCSYTTTSGYLTAISISDPCSHSNCLSTTPMVYQLSIQIRQNTMDVGGNFYVTTKTSSADIGIGSYANSITISPNPFVSYSLDNSGCNTVKASCSLSVKFTTVYTFPNKSNGGKISLTIPSDLTVVSTSCTATIGSSSMECSLASSVVTATHSLTTSVAGMQVIITFPTITNPSSTKPTSTFVFYSQESTSGTYYNIDGITSGLTYSVSTLGALSSVTVTRDTLDASNTGLKTGSATNFLFSFIITNDVASDGTFTIILPTESDAKLISTSTDYQCSATDCTTGSSISCTVTSSTRTILMTNYCSSASGRSCTGGSTIKICLKKNFMQNMGWIKSPLASTDSFAIKSGLSGGVYFTDGVTSSIVATPSLIPNLITFSSSPQISRTSNTVDVKVDWTFSITFSANSLTSTDYAYLTLPSDVVYDMGETLTTVLTSNSSLEVGNSKTLYSTGAINIIKLTSICGSTGCAKSSQLSFKISWFKNPPAVTTVTSTIKIDSATSQGWIIDEGVTSAVNTVFSTLIAASVTSTSITPSNPTSGATTNYNVIFTADTSIPTGSVVVITLPSDVTISSTNTGGSTSLNTCANLFDTTVSITCTVGTNASGQTTITVTGLFPGTTNSGQFGVDLGLLLNPSTTGSTGSFGINIVTSSGNSVASIPSGSTSTTTIDSPVSSCNALCKTCAGTSTTCTSCNSPSNYPFYQGTTCVNSCSSGYFLSGTTCYACHASCSECSGYKDSNCLSCKSGYYFENGYCVTECGKNTVITNGQCVSTSANGVCSSSCTTCSKSTSWCLSCVSTSSTPIVNPVDGTCTTSAYNSCNTGYYVDLTTNSCQKCSTRCKDCNLSSTSCFSCWSFFVDNILDWATYTCVSTCSTNSYYDSSTNTCPACNNVCKTCTYKTPSTCTSCNKTPGGQQLYLSDGECVVNCPKPYIENTSSNKCERSAFDIVSGPLLTILALVGISGVLLVVSKIVSIKKKNKDKTLEEAYAYLTFIQFLARIFLLGNLWAKAQVFTFALISMIIACTGVLGIFFHFLFLEPIFIHSPQFKATFTKYKKTFWAIIITSWIVGVNFIRLMYSRVFGTQSTSSDLNIHYFFVKPLNNIANFTLIFNGIGIIQSIVVIFQLTVGYDAWALAVFTMAGDLCLVLLQIAKIFQMRKFMAQYQKLNS